MKLIKTTILYSLIMMSISTIAQDFHNQYFRGLANIEYQNYQDAIDNFSKAIELEQNNSEFYLKRGQCYYLISQFENAITDFLYADSINPASASFYLARSYARLGEWLKAVNYLKIHLNSKHKLPKSEIKLDNAFNKLQNTQEWKKLWLADWYSKDENILSDAEYLMKNKDYYDALETLNKILLRKTSYHKAYYLRAKVNVLLEDTKSAIADYDEAISIKKKNPEYVTERARVYYQLKKYKKSLIDYEQAIELNPLDIKLYYERALVNLELKQYARALEDVQKYLKYFIKDQEALYHCGIIYYNTKDYLDALLYFNKTLELSPVKAKYYFARANTYLMTKTYKYAVKDYSMVLDLNPRWAEVYFNRGLAYFSLGNKQRACSDWKKAKELKYMQADDYMRKNCR